MWLNKIYSFCTGRISFFSQLMSRIGAIALVSMMFLTAADVILRYCFNRPISGAYEITEYLMVILIGFGFAYCTLLKRHVTLDVLASRFPQRTSAIINSILYLFIFGLFVLVVWQSIEYTTFMHARNVKSSMLSIPRYPFIAALTFGFVIVSVVLLNLLIDFVRKALGK